MSVLSIYNREVILLGLLVAVAILIAVLSAVTDLLRQWYAKHLEHEKGDTAPNKEYRLHQPGARHDVALITRTHAIADGEFCCDA